MKPIWQILQPSQLGTTLDDVKSALGGFTTKMALDLQRILSNGATFKDNLATAYIEFDAIHGTEMPITNPFRSVPQAFIPISAFTLVGGVGGRNNGVQLAIAGQPILNLSRTDGFLGITVQYAPPLGLAAVCRVAALNQAPGNQIIPFDTTLFSAGSSLTPNLATGEITCTAAGIVRVSVSLDWLSAIGLNRKVTFATLNFGGFVDLYGLCGANIAGENGQSGTGLAKVVAGDKIAGVTSQDNAGALAVSVANNRTRMDVQYVAPDPATTARVRGILVEA